MRVISFEEGAKQLYQSHKGGRLFLAACDPNRWATLDRIRAMYSLGGIAIVAVAVLFLIGLDKLWFRILIPALFLGAIVAIAYFGGKANI